MDTPSDPSSDPHIGRVLQERYKILRLLGRGGMGTVYEAEHILIQRRLAVKFLHPELASQTEAVQRFVNEARAASSIGNDHIVRVTDMGRLSDREHYMVLEFLEGDSFAEVLDGSLLEVDRVVRIVRMVCDALAAAHAKGIVHRDLKPENIFLVPTDAGDFVKLLDFGIAKFHQQQGALTKTGAVMGTPAYMAPEQARGRTVDARTDIFSLGVILYEAFSGFHPFDADSFVDILYRVAHEEPERLDRFRPDLDPKLVELVHRMLSKKPAGRPSSCAEVERELARGFTSAVDPLQRTAPQGQYARTPTSITLEPPDAETEGQASEEQVDDIRVPTRGRVGWIALALFALLAGGVLALYTGEDPVVLEAPRAVHESVIEPPAGLPVPSLEAETRARAEAAARVKAKVESEAQTAAVRRRASSAMRPSTMRSRAAEMRSEPTFEGAIESETRVAMPSIPSSEMEDPPPFGGFKRVRL